MSYIINNSRGQIVAVVADGTTNSTATDLTLVGRAVTNFGEFQNENYVYLLENFADSVAPSQPILGQLWYNSSTDEISAYSTANVFVALASQDYVQAQKISPAFTGVPTAPTANAGTASTQLATTAFVTNSVQLAGVPTAPTATVSTNTTQIATTAFVQNNKVSPAFSGTPTAPTAAYNTNTTQIATTAFVQGEKLSPVLSGTPTAPTAAYNTNTTQIATTAFVQGEKVSPAFSGAPTAPTAANGVVNTQIASTEFVVNSLDYYLGSISVQNANAVAITGGTISGIVPLALTDGGTGASTPVLARTNLQLGDLATQNVGNVFITGGQITGIIDLAIADGGTGASNAADARNNLGLATGAVTTVGTMAVQNASAVNITGGDISGITPLPVASGGTAGGTAAQARTNLSVPPNSRTITGINGLTGGGDLSADRTITIANTSNGYGNRYVNTGAPNIPGVSGDIWYQII
jgi:hypothetical protein